MKKTFDLYSRRNQILLDGCVFAAALTAAFIIRFESLPSGFNLHQLLVWIPLLVGGHLFVNVTLGVYRLVWRFVSLSDAIKVTQSLLLVTMVLLVARYFTPDYGKITELLRLPFGVIVTECLLATAGTLGFRVLRRFLYSYHRQSLSKTAKPPSRVLLYGAGRAGQLLVRELEANRMVDVVGFVDDDKNKIGAIIAGTRVLNDGDHLSQLVRQFQVEEIVISMATASRKTLASVVAKCRQAGIAPKIIPSVQEILSGNLPISHLRETRIQDVLGRESVEMPNFEEALGNEYRNKRVLVTGAGGSIGSELVRQLLRLGPERVAILDKDENSIYELEQELVRRGYGDAIEAQIADVRNRARLRAVLSHFRPHLVFHAAAHKHVPLMEKAPCEAVINNVGGTRNALEIAAECGVEKFVFISTDKAVNPVNIMGATKRIGEMLAQACSGQGNMQTACVRFGNVLGSRGSVIPLFQKQIEAGGPVTVTHPEMVRYFMTIPEAVQLILCAGSLAQRGKIFVLEMGTPRNILELAREMITLSGFEPGKDICTEITGLRPGEKLFEELVRSSEKLTRTPFDKLNAIEPEICETQEFFLELNELMRLAEDGKSHQIYETLSHMNLEFKGSTGNGRARAAAAGV